MSLIKIQEKLNILGYSASLKSDVMLIVGKQLEPLEDFPNVFYLDYYCSVVEVDGIYRIFYGNRNYQPSIDKKTTSDVTTWIKQHYPL